MKIKLLNDGGYGEMENVDFPVEVEGTPSLSNGTVTGYYVLGEELYRIGATMSDRYPFIAEDDYYFIVESEAVAV